MNNNVIGNLIVIVLAIAVLYFVDIVFIRPDRVRLDEIRSSISQNSSDFNSSEISQNDNYIILWGKSTDDLSVKVNQALNDGWELQGGAGSVEAAGYYQAMKRSQQNGGKE